MALKIRVFITAGDELLFINTCNACGLRGEIGGPPACDGQIDGFERPNEEKVSRGGRSDWSVVYINCERVGQAMAVRAQFRQTINKGE